VCGRDHAPQWPQNPRGPRRGTTRRVIPPRHSLKRSDIAHRPRRNSLLRHPKPTWASFVHPKNDLRSRPHAPGGAPRLPPPFGFVELLPQKTGDVDAEVEFRQRSKPGGGDGSEPGVRGLIPATLRSRVRRLGLRALAQSSSSKIILLSLSSSERKGLNRSGPRSRREAVLEAPSAAAEAVRLDKRYTSRRVAKAKIRPIRPRDRLSRLRFGQCVPATIHRDPRSSGTSVAPRRAMRAPPRRCDALRDTRRTPAACRSGGQIPGEPILGIGLDRGSDEALRIKLCARL